MSLTAETTRFTQKAEEFSLVSGGLFNALLERLHLLRPPVELMRKRTLVLCGITWLPLLVMSMLEGNAWGSRVTLPFLHDVGTHARFLVAIPLLFLADFFAYTHMPPTLEQFTKRHIIDPKDHAEFEAILARVPKLTGAILPEVICLLIAYTAGHLVWARAFSSESTWYLASGERSMAGFWYEWVSLPLLRFLFFRWFYRLGVWAYALFKISRLPLNLVASHPDRVGGLGFLNQVSAFFLPLISAWGVLLSGQVAAKMISEGLDLKSFKFEGIGVLIIAVLFILAPLLFFTPILLQARRRGLREFGALGARYTREFEEKWIQGKEKNEPLVGSADIQSLADLANSYEVVKRMNMVIISRGAILQVLWALALPCLPLLLTVIPLSELLKRLLKLVI